MAPSLEVCGDMLEKIEQKLQTTRSPAISESVSEESTSSDNTKASGKLLIIMKKKFLFSQFIVLATVFGLSSFGYKLQDVRW